MENLSSTLNEMKDDQAGKDLAIILAKRDLMAILSEKTIEYLQKGQSTRVLGEIITEVFTMYEVQIDSLASMVEQGAGGSQSPVAPQDAGGDE